MGDTVATSIRLPVELKKELEKLAEQDSRSLNNYLVLILQRWVKEHCKEEN